MAGLFPCRSINRNSNRPRLRTIPSKSPNQNRNGKKKRVTTRPSGCSQATETYRSLELTTENIFENTKHMFRHVLKDETIRQLYAYVRCLPVMGSMEVDRKIFEAEMLRWFDITNRFILSRMYRVKSGYEKKCTTMNVEQYLKLICLFVCDDLEMKIKFAFDVYDTHEKGELDRRDYEALLEQVQYEVGSEESEVMGPQSLASLILKICDKNNDGKIDFGEFRYLAHRNKLLLEALGHCLPCENKVIEFMEMFGDKTATEVRGFFRDERRKALRSPAINSNTDGTGVQKYYPIPLDLP